jgi:hypothetical protein
VTYHEHAKGVTDRTQIGVYPAGHPYAPTPQRQNHHEKGPQHGTRDA